MAGNGLGIDGNARNDWARNIMLNTTVMPRVAAALA